MKAKTGQIHTVKLEQFVPGGQVIATLPHGQRVFVWGGLPGEEVNITITKVKRNYAEAVVDEVVVASQDRRQPIEKSYISTSPWQILDWGVENTVKQQLLKESFGQNNLEVEWQLFHQPNEQYHYRNKMEFSFWWDHEVGLRLAFHQRGSRHKLPVEGSELAMDAINEVAQQIVSLLNQEKIEAFQLKSLMLRASQDMRVAAALFVKDLDFSGAESLSQNIVASINALDGLAIYYSSHRSPASVVDKELARAGSIELQDKIGNKSYSYDVLSFFQVSLKPYQQALADIAKAVEGDTKIVDYFSGVGSIGLHVGAKLLVEVDPLSTAFARQNAIHHDSDAEVVQAPSEQALNYLDPKQTVIVDPPRAGLHKKFIQNLTEVKPQKIVYLSCNPATQARDISWLAPHYKVAWARGYNFFPRTPHIESLVVVQRAE